MDLDLIRTAFFQECAELLAELETHLLALAAGSEDSEAMNAAFRAAHSIKGGAAAFKFDALVHFAHRFEEALDRVRAGRLQPLPEDWALCLKACDVLADLVAQARDGTGGPIAGHEPVAGALAQMAARSGPAAPAPKPPPTISFEPAPAAPPPDTLDGRVWRVDFVPRPALFASGNDPIRLFRTLAELGELRVETDFTDLPPLSELDLDTCPLRFALELRGPGPRNAIEDVFCFVDDLADITIAEDGAIAAPKPDEPSFETILASLRTPASPAPPPPEEAPIAAPELAPGPAPEPEIASAPAKAGPRAAARSETMRGGAVRVDIERLDRVGAIADEVSIACAALSARVGENLRRKDPELQRALDILTGHVRALQDAALALRAAPIKTIFQRMPRVAREAAEATGKQIRLELIGEEVEIDKTLVDAVADPLVHLLRNSIDHGVETPERRLAAGKAEEGRVTLSAEQTGGRIIIRIADDGAGLNSAKILARARERGLIGANDELSDNAAADLIFAPGFSTAEKVTDISGRGVGLDVVRDNVRKVGGRVEVRSTPGKGATFTLSFPLTLAVIDAMLVRVRSETYAIPINEISETLRVADMASVTLSDGSRAAQHRGILAPLLDAASLLNLPPGLDGASPTPARKALGDELAVMCALENGARVGLLIDEVTGQSQVAVKGLEAHFTHIPGLAGGAILGDGRVALILDVRGLKELADRRGPRRLAG